MFFWNLQPNWCFNTQNCPCSLFYKITSCIEVGIVVFDDASSFRFELLHLKPFVGKRPQNDQVGAPLDGNLILMIVRFRFCFLQPLNVGAVVWESCQFQFPRSARFINGTRQGLLQSIWLLVQDHRGAEHPLLSSSLLLWWKGWIELGPD